jgi:hypothetical protein
MTVSTAPRTVPGPIVVSPVSPPFTVELTISRPLGLELGTLGIATPPQLGDLRLVVEDVTDVVVDIQKPGHIIFDIQKPGHIVLDTPPLPGGPVGTLPRPIVDIQKPGHIVVDITRPGHVDLGIGRSDVLAMQISRPTHVDIIRLDD